jgi:hypothetical protein
MPEYLCDFDRLRKSNGLLYKWSIYFEIKNCSFLNFVYKFQKNKNVFFKKIKCPVKRVEFLDDWDFMFFARKIENDLIRQYMPVVFKVLRRFKIKNQEIYENAFDVAISALRGSVWRYRLETVKFLSYAMTGIICAVRGYVFHEKEIFKRKQPKMISICRSEVNDSIYAENVTLCCPKSLEPWQQIEDEIQLNEKNIAKLSGLTTDETYLLKLKLKNPKYREKFIEYYTKKYGKPCSKTTLYRVWNITKRKIFKKVEQIRGSKFADLLRA